MWFLVIILKKCAREKHNVSKIPERNITSQKFQRENSSVLNYQLSFRQRFDCTHARWVEIHQSSTNGKLARDHLFDCASLHEDIELMMKKGFLLSSSSSSSSKVVNERNKPSSVILPDDQSQSRKSSSNRVSNALLDLEEDSTNKGSSHLHPSSLLKVVRMQNNDNNLLWCNS